MKGRQTVGDIRQLAISQINPDHAQKMFGLQTFVAGNTGVWGDSIGRATERYTPGDLPDFPDIDAESGDEGVQNHGLVNARINVQGVVGMVPTVEIQGSDPTIKAVQEAWFAQEWTDGGYSAEWMNVGMDEESVGIGLAFAGSDRGATIWSHKPVLDCIWDRYYRNPRHWRIAGYRDRLSPDEAVELFGSDAERFAFPIRTVGPRNEVEATSNRPQSKQVRVYHLYTGTAYVSILNSLADGQAYVWNGQEYKPIDDGANAPENVYGCIPVATWVDSWGPGSMYPTAKPETYRRLAAMLNTIERFMVRCVYNSVPIGVIDTTRIEDVELLQKLRDGKSRSIADIDRLIAINGGSIEDVIQRLPAVDVPNVCLQLRGILKEELNAATGVQDMQRGQALSGERTREEIRTLADMSGVQAKHIRNQYADFVRQVVEVSRQIGAIADNRERTLYLPDGPIPVGGRNGFPLSEILGKKVPVLVSPESLVYKTKEERQSQALALFSQVLMPSIEMGVSPKDRVFRWLWAECGFTNADTVFYTAEEAKQIADLQMKMREMGPTGQEAAAAGPPAAAAA